MSPSGVVIPIVLKSTDIPAKLRVPRSGAWTRPVYTEGITAAPPEGRTGSLTLKVPRAPVTTCVVGSGAPPTASMTPSGAPSWFSSRNVMRPVTSSGSAPGAMLSK